MPPSAIVDNNYTSETHEGAIKKGQSRDTGNLGHKTQNEDIQNKKQKQKIENKNISNTDPTKNRKLTYVLLTGSSS